MSKFAVMLYPDFSLQEITCLTSVLSVWFGEKIDFISSGAQEVTSEEGPIQGISSMKTTIRLFLSCC